MKRILIIKPDDGFEHDFIAEILKAEGLFHFDIVPTEALDKERLKTAGAVVTLRGSYGTAETELLLEYVREGGGLIAVMPGGKLAERLGVGPWGVASTQKPDPTKAKGAEPGVPSAPEVVSHGKVIVHPTSGLTVSPEPLYCPLETTYGMGCEGEVLADLIDEFGKKNGAAIVRKQIGKGRAYVLGYDIVGAVLRLRHGTWELEQDPRMFPLRGPRHMFGMIGIAERHSRQHPLGDILQDIFREMLLDVQGPTITPRLWHMPDAQKVLVFFKSDGCGEEGGPVGIELAERYGQKHNFFRAPVSRFDGKTIREWHERGHYMSIETNIHPITWNHKLEELDDRVHEQIREEMGAQAKRFTDETELEVTDIVIHGCQWTGMRTAQILMDHGWRMPFHFCIHDPRMSRHDFGPFSVPSAMPMRFFDREAGVLELYLQPCTFDDSQSITEEGTGKLGLNQVEYAEAAVQWVVDSRDRWHVPHIGTFHPCYLVREKGHPRRTFEAANIVYASLAAMGIESGSLGEWSQWVQARDGVTVELLECDEARTVAKLTATRAVEGLTLLAEANPPVSRILVDGREQDLLTLEIEGRRCPAVVISLAADQEVEIGMIR